MVVEWLKSLKMEFVCNSEQKSNNLAFVVDGLETRPVQTVKTSLEICLIRSSHRVHHYET